LRCSFFFPQFFFQCFSFFHKLVPKKCRVSHILESAPIGIGPLLSLFFRPPWIVYFLFFFKLGFEESSARVSLAASSFNDASLRVFFQIRDASRSRDFFYIFLFVFSLPKARYPFSRFPLCLRNSPPELLKIRLTGPFKSTIIFSFSLLLFPIESQQSIYRETLFGGTNSNAHPALNLQCGSSLSTQEFWVRHILMQTSRWFHNTSDLCRIPRLF